jgi:hypothetical protein
VYNNIQALKLRNFGRDAQFSLACGRMYSFHINMQYVQKQNELPGWKRAIP